MDFYRKLLFALDSNYTDTCDDSTCDPHSCFECLKFSPPIPIYPSSSEKANPLSHVVIIVIAVLSSAFLLVSYYTIIKKYCSRWRTPRVPPAQDSHVDDELDESTSPMNYIWYVNTVGLEESVINSIAICKYKKGEGLVEGTDCSVCLSEFEDDEKLRLLPKCNHAFHIPCIDTWLKSHVNCPLCRANIVSAPDPNSNCSDSSSVTHAENSQNNVGDRDGRTSEGEVEVESERQDGRLDAETLEALSLPRARVNSGIRVLSDLGGIQRSSECSIEMMGGAIQPVRRSVSMDSSAAAMFCLSLTNLLQTDSEGGNNVNIGESSGARRMGPTPKYGRNRSLIKMVYSGSKRPFLFKGPIAMKRSLSSGGKFLSRTSRSKNSVLPL